jgi:hypothetical protein
MFPLVDIATQQYNCVMIPPNSTTGNLPPGIHPAARDEVEARFATTPHRKRLLDGFWEGIEILRIAGCKRVYLDGSFITSKTVPGDFDALWDPTGVNLADLLSREPVFWNFDNGRTAQKAKFRGEFIPSTATEHGTGKIFLDFFQQDRDTGLPKGIVAIDL